MAGDVTRLVEVDSVAIPLDVSIQADHPNLNSSSSSLRTPSGSSMPMARAKSTIPSSGMLKRSSSSMGTKESKSASA